MTERAISINGFNPIPAPPDLGAVPMLQWVDINDLVVDETYQRKIQGNGRKNVIADLEGVTP